MKGITLKAVIAAGYLVLAIVPGCGHDYQNPEGCIQVRDHDAALTSDGHDALFTIELQALSDPEYAFDVDHLEVAFTSRNWISTVKLTRDINHDGLFGVGDLLTVYEDTFSVYYQSRDTDETGARDVFSQQDSGTRQSFDLLAWDLPIESNRIHSGHIVASGTWKAF